MAALVVLLAGCSQAPVDDSAGAPVDATLGTVSGVVVDAAIRPLVASIEMDGQLAATSAADGTFEIVDLVTGAHLLRVNATGFLPKQVAITVAAGESTPLRIQLVVEPSDKPFVQTVPFDGFYQVSLGLVTAVADQLDDPLGLLKCRCSFTVQPGPGLSRMVLEVFWDDSVHDPTGATQFAWQIEAVGTNGTATGTGESPISRVLGRLDFPVQGFEFSDAPEYEVRIYPDATWPGVSQNFQAFLSLWYGGPPPEDWSVNNP